MALSACDSPSPRLESAPTTVEQPSTTETATAPSSQAPATSTLDETTTSAAPEVASAGVSVAITLVDGSVVGGVQTVSVDVGDTVLLTVISDINDELHLHVYDVVVEVVADEPTTLGFTASIPGVFEAELEGRGQRIVEFEVS